VKILPDLRDCVKENTGCGDVTIHRKTVAMMSRGRAECLPETGKETQPGDNSR
jgi:hypothetical protein